MEAPTIGFMISEPTSEFGSLIPGTALRLASQSGLELSVGVSQLSGTERCAGLSQSQIRQTKARVVDERAEDSFVEIQQCPMPREEEPTAVNFFSGLLVETAAAVPAVFVGLLEPASGIVRL